MSKKSPRQQTPIHSAVSTWLSSLGSVHVQGDHESEDLVTAAPKRFTIYEPMVLLPSGSFAQPVWSSLLRSINGEARSKLWSLILGELSRSATKTTLTHLAINDGIPPQQEDDDAENILRSPVGLRMLHGDFGPSAPVALDWDAEDFEKALWVSTKQNGIQQTWAPRWTMFSRGNVKEKARLLGFRWGQRDDAETCAVDLYAGIGYFVFSYASLGLRVLCWELNPWSVEGLRRGAMANRWSVKVVQGADLARPTEELVQDGERIVVFLEDNQKALGRIRSLQSSTVAVAREIRHVNCGFLPTSEPTWRAAFEATDQSSDSWLHLHENVGAADVDARRKELQDHVTGWAAAEGGQRVPVVEHVELVKTYAPGVWHCVFDVHIARSINDGSKAGIAKDI
jgi:tRNA wybutosine-synthesizing protein 2